MAPAARRKANRLRIVCVLRPANNRPPGAARGRTTPWRGRTGPARMDSVQRRRGGGRPLTAPCGRDWWTRYDDFIDRRPGRGTAPSFGRREGRRSAGSIDRQSRLIRPASRPPRRVVLHGESRARFIEIFIEAARSRARSASRCLLIEANGVRPRRRLFLELVARYLAISGSSTFLSAALAHPPRHKCVLSVTNHISSNLQYPVSVCVQSLFLLVPGKRAGIHL